MSGKAAVFLDRDGTLNEEVDYLHDPEDLALIAGAAKAVASLNARGIPVIVVTNQSGIGRGYYGFEEFNQVTARMAEALAQEGAHVDAVYVAPHHEKGQGAFAHPDHPERKPNAGMLTRAAEEHALDLSRSWMIGDKESDLEAGRRAGCRVALVRTGYGKAVDGSLADLVADNVLAAVDQILETWP